MRRPLIIIAFILTAASLLAEDLKTRDGTVYKNATITTVTPAYVTVMHHDGVARVMLENLPEELQRKYGYDPEKAAQFMSAEVRAEQEAARESELAATQQRQAAAATQLQAEQDAITKNTRTIREVQTDQLNFLDKPFFLEGTIELSSYYNWGYEGAEPTHYSFELRSRGKSCHVYMERSKAAALRKQLLDAGGSLKGLFAVVLLKSRYQESSQLLLELLDYRPPLQ